MGDIPVHRDDKIKIHKSSYWSSTVVCANNFEYLSNIFICKFSQNPNGAVLIELVSLFDIGLASCIIIKLCMHQWYSSVFGDVCVESTRFGGCVWRVHILHFWGKNWHLNFLSLLSYCFKGILASLLMTPIRHVKDLHAWVWSLQRNQIVVSQLYDIVEFIRQDLITPLCSLSS